MKSEKIKVVGISKVTIPTFFHSRVPYFVLVLEDENGNKWVQKSIREYKIGEELKIKSVSSTDVPMRRNAVAIWRIKYDILEGIEKVIELLGGLNINQNSKILILPTLISATHPHFAENTSPQFLEAAIKYLIERGVKPEDIKVCGQSFDEIPIAASAQKSQLLRVCQNYKILPLNLAKTNFVKRSEGQFSFEISEEVFNSDLIINLPILKMGRVAASENILKFLKKESYLGLKYLFSDEEIRKALRKTLPTFLTIADGEMVQKPDKFTCFLGLILASFNFLNLDRIFGQIVGQLPEYFKEIKIEDIPIVGREIEEIQYGIEKF